MSLSVSPTNSKEHDNALNEIKISRYIGRRGQSRCFLSGRRAENRLVAEVEKMFGRIDLLVNCLKLETDSTSDETNETDFDSSINANLKSVFFVTQEAMRLMKPRPTERSSISFRRWIRRKRERMLLLRLRKML